MQRPCKKPVSKHPSTWRPLLDLQMIKVEEICTAGAKETGEVVVPANYNCPGQLVISGSIKGVEIACEQLKAAGAKRALLLPVGGAFHSPLMEPAKKELQKAIEATNFNTPSCPVYQNVVAKGVIDKDEIKQNLIDQLTGAVRWTQCVQAMIADGASKFTKLARVKYCKGLLLKINKEVNHSRKCGVVKLIYNLCHYAVQPFRIKNSIVFFIKINGSFIPFQYLPLHAI